MYLVEILDVLHVQVNWPLATGVIFFNCSILYFVGQCSMGYCFNGGRCTGGYNPKCMCNQGFQGPRCQYGKL